MARGQVNLSVVSTNDEKYLLQVQEPDAINRVMDNNITVHEDVDSLLAELRKKLHRQLPQKAANR
jgi:hypothetical protein